MEVSLLIRIQNLTELEDWVKMMTLFPALGKTLKLEKQIDGLTKKAEALKNEIQKLEGQKSSLLETPIPQPATVQATA